MAAGEPSREPSHSPQLICESYSSSVTGTYARFILSHRARKRKMPHTGLLIRNERLSIELGHLSLNSNVNEIILQLGPLGPDAQAQRPGCLGSVLSWPIGGFKVKHAGQLLALLRPLNTKSWD